jgi:putative ABC transport system permease protein
MLTNYFKTAWRNVKKNKGFFTLNFIGLYISVVVCTLIMLILLHETSFDQSADKAISLYRVVGHSSSPTGRKNSAATPYPLATAMRAAMPAGDLISQIHFQGDDVISFGDKKFKEKYIVFADSVFPRLFPLSVKEGSIRRALAEPGFVILTETAAQRYFGKEEAVGKRIKLANLIDLEVAAVVADPPPNTHLPYHILVSYPSLKPALIGNLPLNQWSLTAEGFVYIGLPGANQVRSAEAQIAAILAEHPDRDDDPGTKSTMSLQPLKEIHFDQLYAGANPSYTISYEYLYLIGAIGLFLILAACINYVNLSTALAIRKSKEVGVRKTLGAGRAHLIKQFLSETFLLTAVVIVIAALSVRLFLPMLNQFLDRNIPLDWLTIRSGLFLLCLWVVVSLLSGIYPAFVLSGFNPITALKSKVSAAKASVVLLRRGLVVFQFLTAQVLIIGAIVVAKQMHFMQSKPLGFEKEKVVDIEIPDPKANKLAALRNQLSGIPGVSSYSLSLGAPVSNNNFNTGFNLKEKYSTEHLETKIKSVDKGYLNTYGLQLAAGRWFDENDGHRIDPSIPDSLRRYALVLNETAVKAMGFRSPQDVLGKYVTFGLNDMSAPVIGVVKDYHVASLHETVMPVLMAELPFFYYNLGIKLSNGYTPAALSAVEKAWTSVYPEHLFQSNFLDEHIADLYKEEKRTEELFNLFAFLSIAINMLGLIGLLSFMIEQKRKEIGIRKVLGASIRNISFILSKDFLRLILIAFLVAAPVAGLLMNRWLRDFAYRTEISWWVFAVAVLAALVITCVAVGFQTIKAAVTNPVKSLKTE